MSKIEWTDKTWNPVTGCTKISAGCKNCYAETMAKRLQAMGMLNYTNGFTLQCHENSLNIPLKRKAATMYFVCSMSDLFHYNVPFSFIDKVMKTILSTPQHTYQILTKRPDTMARYFSSRAAPDNAWLGTSVENKRHGIPRIDLLRGIRAKVVFLSIEPLLEDLGRIDLSGINWVIVGGESGHKARPMNPEWVDSIQRRCEDQNVKFFFKQWGSWGADGIKRNKKQNGCILNGRTWQEIPITNFPLK